jgi:hypothetical protein
LAINGGGTLTVSYEKSGYSPVQRQARVAWLEVVTIAKVAMVAMDPVVTPIALGTNSPMQVHQGSVSDGRRWHPPGNSAIPLPALGAYLVLGTGITQSVSSLHIRATEFTVGSNGPAAMPATLPPLSGYTYCAELSADEATAANATHVMFDRPLSFYVENFLHSPVGTVVPFGTL